MFELTKEVVTGIAGALVVSFLGLCAAWAHSFYIRRKYPVGGTYVTHFEDVVQGKPVMQMSMSRLRQRGRRLLGTNTLKNGRRWLLDGSIVGVGHISGVYSAEAPDDEGVGAFYLRINGLVLDGLWSGYDHVNKKITSGRYIFKRVLKVRIQKLRHKEAPSVLAIAEKAFGPRYFSVADLNGASGLDVFVAKLDGKIVGFAATEKDSSVSTKLRAPVKLPMDIELAEKKQVLGVIRTVAVIEGLQGHGIGEQLFLAMERALRQAGRSLIAVPAWEDDTGVHLAGILTGNGYEPFLTCKNYWMDDCDNGLFSCKSRQGQNQCRCNLIWYKKAAT